MTRRKKAVLLGVLLSGIILLSGCETAGGAAKGVGFIAEGAAKDTANLWGAMLKADSWIKKNLW